jgi:hypothetical protein
MTMNTDKLESQTCNDIHRLSDHELEVVTGGADKNLVWCQTGPYPGMGDYMTPQQCNAYHESQEILGGKGGW